MALVFLPEIGVVLTAAGQAALTAIGNGAVLSLGGDTSVRLKHRQGRRQSRKPLALPCWSSITQHGTNKENTRKYKAFRLVHIIAQNAQRSDYHSRHTSVDVSINNQ